MDDKDDELSSLLRKHATRHRADAQLRAGVHAGIAMQTAAGDKRARPVPAVAQAKRWPWWTLLGSGFATGALACLLTVFVVQHGQREQELRSRMVAEVVGSHVRALMAAHLTDVASTDQHTVKPWFQGKLNYAPPVRDFKEQGFPLIGGRLEYLDGQPVAALVYRHGQHAINVFVWPGSAAAGALPGQQGFHVQQWADGGMQLWAVSDVSPADLETLKRLWLTPAP